MALPFCRWKSSNRTSGGWLAQAGWSQFNQDASLVKGHSHGCCRETCHIFAYCGLVVEIQPLICFFLFTPLPTSTKFKSPSRVFLSRPFSGGPAFVPTSLHRGKPAHKTLGTGTRDGSVVLHEFGRKKEPAIRSRQRKLEHLLAFVLHLQSRSS